VSGMKIPLPWRGVGEVGGVVSLAVANQVSEIIAKETGDKSVSFVYRNFYQPGDKIIITVPHENSYWVIRLEDSMSEALIYMSQPSYEFPIPFEADALAYNPKSFKGNLHLLSARAATKFEIDTYRNLALNPYDTRGNSACFPRAFANTETRGEAVFAARNTVDGISENRGHGGWPYQSWGINKNPDAELTVDFGRAIEANKIILHTRADFPHDNWWRQASFVFSDGSKMTVTMEKSSEPHVFVFAPKKILWVKVCELIKCETDPSEFPALSQIEVFGRNL